MRVGCAAYSYRDYLRAGKMSLGDFLKKGVELGLDGVELTSYFFPSTDDAYLYSLKRQAYLLGLDVPAAAVGNNFCLEDARARAKQVALVKEWVDISVKLGTPCLRVFGGPIPKGHTEEEAFGWTAACLQECVAYAEPKGILLALENHGGITATADQVLNLIKAVDSEWLRVNLDTGNYRGDPYEEIARTAPYAATAHAKTELPAAEGKEAADVERIVRILDKAGYKGYLSIEYEAAADPMTAVPKFVAQLKRAVSGIR